MSKRIHINDETNFYKDNSDEAEPNGTEVPNIDVIDVKNSKTSKTKNTDNNQKIKNKQSSVTKSQETLFIEDVQKIYEFFKKKISYEQILFSIHHNEGSLKDAIIELSKNPKKYKSSSLAEIPLHKNDLPVSMYEEYISFD